MRVDYARNGRVEGGIGRVVVCAAATLVASWCVAQQPAKVPPGEKVPAKSASGESKASVPKVAHPHPMICEILYSVPKGIEGDADGNGTRSATGDEFIEIYNPHSRPIELKGYVLSDAAPLTGPESDGAKKANSKPNSKSGSKPGGKPSAKPAAKPTGTPNTNPARAPRQDSEAVPADTSDAPEKSTKKRSRLRFEFPALTLQPGEVAVVFNGYETRATGSVGSEQASAGKNEKFGKAYVFSMGVASQFAALANEGDCVTLFAPDGRAVQCVRWGEAENKKLDSAIVMMVAPAVVGSATLDAETGEFVEHPARESEDGSRKFSPGVFGDSSSNSNKGRRDQQPASKRDKK